MCRLKLPECNAFVKKIKFYNSSQFNSLRLQRKLNNEMRLELAKLIETEAALLDLRDNVEKRRQIHDDAGRELEEARKVLREASVPIPHGNTSRAAEGLNALEQLRSRRAEIHRQTLDRQRSVGFVLWFNSHFCS